MSREVIVRMEQVVKEYQNGPRVRALEGITLDIYENEFIAICGPSGSGKTTMLNLIAALDMPTQGKIWVQGVDIHTLNGNAQAEFRRRYIGFVFQTFNLLPEFTALENVMLPLLPYRRHLDFDLRTRAEHLLRAVGLEKRIHHLPAQLSGGEQQRVAIARALVNYPKIVLADEPTGNVDSHTGKEIIRLLHNLQSTHGITVIMATHDEAMTHSADRVITLRDGQVESMKRIRR